MARVFVIDDDPALREFIELALGARGHEVTLAASAALDVGEGDFDVAFVDLVTDHIASPLAAIERLVAAGVPVAVVSGLEPDAPAVLDAMSAGASVFLKKPFGIEVLRETCDRLGRRA